MLGKEQLPVALSCVLKNVTAGRLKATCNSFTLPEQNGYRTFRLRGVIIGAVNSFFLFCYAITKRKAVSQFPGLAWRAYTNGNRQLVLTLMNNGNSLVGRSHARCLYWSTHWWRAWPCFAIGTWRKLNKSCLDRTQNSSKECSLLHIVFAPLLLVEWGRTWYN